MNATTEFELLKSSVEESRALVVARPKTGRTNQIRLHLWDCGYPILGDPTYLPDRQVGVNQTSSVKDEPMQLHARRIEFVHPVSGESIEFMAPDPDWIKGF